MSEQRTEFDINQPFVTQEQKFKYWEESKAHIKEANKRIEALESEVAELKAQKVRHDQLVDYLKCGIAEELEQRILELQASNNDLREALKTIAIESHEELWQREFAFKALAATPAESLQTLKEVK